jgi:nicotinic acid mononucleotide adenylyltransferase
MSERAAHFHANPWSGVFYVTGGGSKLISELLTTPGASRSVLEVSVPYANSALADLLGKVPAQACSAPTARAMAMAAFQRAHALSDAGSEPTDRTTLFGLGCTASLATDREKRGRHRAHVAIQTEWDTHFADLEFSSDRASEEDQLLDALWELLRHALSPTVSAPTSLVSVRAQPDWRKVLLGEAPAIATAPHDGKLLLSGSFNPVHQGHRKMLALAEQFTRSAGAFELSITNPDKPPLDYHEVGTRLAQFETPVWLTRLPTFAEKARHFPGAKFVVGVDTIVRIDAIRYYVDEARRDAAMAELVDLGCEFLVFGRTDNGRFLELGDLALSHTLQQICHEIPAADFREDISSTELRVRGQ